MAISFWQVLPSPPWHHVPCTTMLTCLWCYDDMTQTLCQDNVGWSMTAFYDVVKLRSTINSAWWGEMMAIAEVHVSYWLDRHLYTGGDNIPGQHDLRLLVLPSRETDFTATWWELGSIHYNYYVWPDMCIWACTGHLSSKFCSDCDCLSCCHMVCQVKWLNYWLS